MKFVSFILSSFLLCLVNAAEMRRSNDCDQTNIQTSRHRIMFCSDRLGRNMRRICVVECQSDYVLRGSSMSRCVRGSFTPVICTLDENLVEQCEITAFRTCPYTVNEVLEFYEENQLSSANLSGSESEMVLAINSEFVISAINAGNNRCSRYCSRNPNTMAYVQPRICGNLPNRSDRFTCVDCRFNGGCTGAIFSK